jgi:hypothetical protein
MNMDVRAELDIAHLPPLSHDQLQHDLDGVLGDWVGLFGHLHLQWRCCGHDIHVHCVLDWVLGRILEYGRDGQYGSDKRWVSRNI